ncbi:glycoside hydrolase family 97 protein [Shewanella schlegeliana]|uniref:Glycoside hydrolase family 97 protein n=1 Tax=Shewanella schlegeliana TaxID=190308 RepID=A0ABS1SXK3_9GAMM|nr:glycoside hydrolase family 97 protein [Shewanella schlegeliana]MBL4913134.1 glycoside hydrolase family 97 protein [Shewanella schlegeliana]MCL1111148.1 glycoside hydrolase family 97 protein [Shewanella schlegeliana]GIU28096.1 alpha-glucosidase [Shewanella schlegeliana]
MKTLSFKSLTLGWITRGLAAGLVGRLVSRLVSRFANGLAFGLLLSAIGAANAAEIQGPYSLTSPNGELSLTVSAPAEKGVRYSLTVSGKPVLKESVADIVLQAMKSSLSEAKVIDVKHLTVNRELQPHVQQKSKRVQEHYNQLTLSFDNQLALSFRLFDQGLAYRFTTEQGGALVVSSETVALNFDGDHRVLFPEETSFISHNERLYLPKRLTEISSEQFASLPLLVDVDDIKLVITETGLRDYPGLWLEGSGKQGFNARFPAVVLKSELKQDSDRNEHIIQRADYIASRETISTSPASALFPWRVFAIAQNDAELLTNELSYLLADELAIDASWVKPGQVAWDWWNANNVFGVDFNAGLNTQTYKYYIDFAAKFGIEYIVLDEGWHHLDSVLNVVDEIDVEEIIAYGKSKNVDVILWVIWKTLDNELEVALDRFEQWGAAGIKVDFMQRDDQAMVNYYWKIAKLAAQRKLLVDFHGSYKPAGLRRAYPNVITREGVRGLEHNKWGDYITAEHNLTLPFIRQLAGPMDYTPGAMVNAQPENFNINFNRPMSKTTRAHQLAMYVVFESPLQMLADTPSHYLREHESTEFITRVPTVWDETQVLSAKISDHIMIARRSGNQWFIGVMGNSKQREFTLDLSFLGSDNKLYQMHSITDGPNAHRYGSDYASKSEVVTAQSLIKIQLAPSGGWVARLSPH